MNKRMDHHLARLHEQVSWGRTAADETLANLTLKLADLGTDAPLAATKQLMLMVRREAMVMALSDVFIALAAVFTVMLFVVPFIHVTKGPGSGAPPCRCTLRGRALFTAFATTQLDKRLAFSAHHLTS